MAQEYKAVGGAGSAVGFPTGDQFCGLPVGGGCGQHFSGSGGASIYWSRATGAHVVSGAIRTEWANSGWENNFGYPTADAVCGLAAGGCSQTFSAGTTIYWSPGTGAHEVRYALRDEYIKWGAQNGGLGYPTTDEFCGLRVGGGCGQHFSNAASIYWSAPTGAHEVRYALRDEWAALGWENNLGYPTTDEFCGLPVGGGCGQHFSNAASIYWSAATGAHEVRGAMRGEWAALGWENNLGYPVADEFCGLVGGGCGEHFQNGSIYWSPATGAHEVRGALRDEWRATGWEWGKLGYPTTDEFCGLRGGGCGQHFQYGSDYWSRASGAHAVTGNLRAYWSSHGWETGSLGYPVSDSFPVSAGWRQNFQGGYLISNTRTSRVTRY
jgi:uncharacterized protein with LGFP repeats